MNQEKIGNFIKEKRKEHNLTQEDLAAQLGVSNRTISKWENGHGMPDYSMILEVCNRLDISINELLSGEEIKEENYQTMLEENMLKTIDYNNKKRNKKNRKIALIIVILLVLISYIGYRIILIDKYTNINKVRVTSNTTTNKLELTKNDKANTEVRESLKMYIPEGFELITDLKVSSLVNPNYNLFIKNNSNIRVRGGNPFTESIENISYIVDETDTYNFLKKHGINSIFNAFDYYVEHKDDKYNFFSKLSDAKLMYIIKLLFIDPKEKIDYYSFNYDNVEGLISILHDGTNYFANTRITLLTPKEYRSYYIYISSNDNDLSLDDIKDILASFETTIK